MSESTSTQPETKFYCPSCSSTEIAIVDSRNGELQGEPTRKRRRSTYEVPETVYYYLATVGESLQTIVEAAEIAQRRISEENKVKNQRSHLYRIRKKKKLRAEAR